MNYHSYKYLLIYNYSRGSQLVAHVLFIKPKFTYYYYELKSFVIHILKNYYTI